MKFYQSDKTNFRSCFIFLISTYPLFINRNTFRPLHQMQGTLIMYNFYICTCLFFQIVFIATYIFSFLPSNIFRTESLKTPSNMLITNLAVSDLIFSAVNGFPLLSISAFNRKWMWGDTGKFHCMYLNKNANKLFCHCVILKHKFTQNFEDISVVEVCYLIYYTHKFIYSLLQS